MLAIVGGGLVGLSLALALAPLRLPVVVIEKHPTPPADAAVRTIALAHGAMMVYRTLGLWPALEPLVAPINQIHVSEQKRFAKTYISAQEQDLAALGYVINVAALRQVLWDALSAYPHVQVLAPAMVTALQPQTAGWEISFDKHPTISAELVVLADGADSGIAKLLHLHVKQQSYGQEALVANVQVSTPLSGTAYERFTAQGALAMLPQANGLMAMVYASTQASHWLNVERSALISHLQTMMPGQLGHIVNISDVFAYPLSLKRMEQPVQAHLICLGNTARVMHPIAAQGFNLAMRDIAHLVDHIAKKSDNKMLGDLAWLEAYYHSRQQDEQRTITFTDGLVRAFLSDVLPIKCLRGLGLQTLQLSPTLKRLFGLYTTGNLGKLPKLMRGGVPWSE